MSVSLTVEVEAHSFTTFEQALPGLVGDKSWYPFLHLETFYFSITESLFFLLLCCLVHWGLLSVPQRSHLSVTVCSILAPVSNSKGGENLNLKTK